MIKLSFLLACVLVLSALAVNANAQISTTPGSPCYPFATASDGSCYYESVLGWVAYGGTVDHQRWEGRMHFNGASVKGVDGKDLDPCVIHATAKLLNPVQPPIQLGVTRTLQQALLQNVNYVDNRGFPDRKNPRVSDASGISYDLKNGETVDVTVLSAVDNPDVVKGGPVWFRYVSTPACLSARLPTEVNYLAEQQPYGYTLNVFKAEPFSSAPKWSFSGAGSPAGSPAGEVVMGVNIFNPLTTLPVSIHIAAYDQFNRLIAFTGSGSAMPDFILPPLGFLSANLSDILGSAVSNFSGRIEVSSPQGLIQVTDFRRVGLGMSAPPVFVSAN